MSRQWRLLIALLPLLAFGVWAVRAQDTKPEAPKAKAEDVKSVDAIIAAMYNVISGPKGQDRDWDRFRSLFAPGARLIPVVRDKNGGTKARVIDVDEFAKLAGASSKENGFFEKEISREVEEFGAMAIIFSTYESRHEKDGAPFDRGINNVQLLRDGDRWRIVTIYWDRERPETPIPAKYLPKK